MNELLQQIVQLVQAALQGDEQANQLIQVIMQKAQQGDQQAQLVALMIQTVAQQMQQKAKFGAKLTYLKSLKGQCPDGYELASYQIGGKVCLKCKKAQEGTKTEEPKNIAEAFKCGRKLKKKEEGGSVEEAKCGKKMVKKACGAKKKFLNGGSLTMDDLYDYFKCGGKTKKVKKDQKGSSIKERYSYKKEDDGETVTETLTNSKGLTMTRTSDEGGYTIKGFNGKTGSAPHGMKGTALADSLRGAWEKEFPKRKRPILKKKN